MKGVFTDEFVLDESPKMITIYEAILLRAEAEKKASKDRYNPPVEKWGAEETARADARLAAMGRSGDPEKEMRAVESLIRQIETQGRVDTIIAKVLNPKQGTGTPSPKGR